MTLNSFYGSIDLSIRVVFRRIFFFDTAFLIEKIVMIFIKDIEKCFHIVYTSINKQCSLRHINFK